MKLRRRRILWPLALIVILLVAAVGAYALVSGIGQSPLEAWVAKRIKMVAAEQLKPTLEFDTLDYQAPLTVELSGVRLTADDPDRENARVHFIQANTLRLKLAELPKEGEPLKLASATIDGAIVRLIELEDGGLLGFSDLTKETSGDKKVLLSDIMQITELKVSDTILEYNTRKPGTQPMRIDKINTAINIDADDSGLYGLSLALDRAHVFKCDLKGKLDLDEMALDIETMAVDLELHRDQDRYLPPQLQQLIQKYELTGDMKLGMTGRVNLMDPAASVAKFDLGLTAGNGKFAGYRMPIKSLTAGATLGEGVLTLSSMNAELLGGALEGSCRVGLSDTMPVSLNISGEGLFLEQLLVPKEPGGSPAASGKVDLQVNANAPLQQFKTQLAGGGEIKLSNGRIARLPVISALIAFMESEGDVEQIDGSKEGGTDTGHIVFELRGDHAYLSKTDIDASWYAMRGRGKFFFNNKVAMNVNAGPLEKIQNTLGAVGRAIGAVTDNVLTYRVRGRVGELSIAPGLLSGIVGAPGDDESAEDFLKSTNP